MGPRGISDAAALAAVGPTPFFMVGEAGPNETGLVEQRRDLSSETCQRCCCSDLGVQMTDVISPSF